MNTSSTMSVMPFFIEVSREGPSYWFDVSCILDRELSDKVVSADMSSGIYLCSSPNENGYVFYVVGKP